MHINFSLQFAISKNISGITDLYKEWSEFQGILPEKLCEPETADELSRYFNSSKNSRIYIVAKTEDNQIVGVCYIDTFFKNLQTIRLGNMLVKKEFP